MEQQVIEKYLRKILNLKIPGAYKMLKRLKNYV